MKRSTVPNGAAELAVAQWGSGGSTLLALHPSVGDSRIWQWCAPAWAATGLRTVAYDRRGFGETCSQPEAYDALADLLAVTAATDARPAVVIGNSRGGSLALDLALAHPDQVRALVLVGAPLRATQRTIGR